jgi:hypothetical protein
MTETAEKAFEAHAWASRPLVVYAPSAAAQELARQRQALEPVHDRLHERDIVLVEVVGEDVETLLGGRLNVKAADLRAYHKIDADAFAVVLVGKDGGVKLNSDHPVTPDQLFSLIDAMPMRRREMAERSGV